jgi:hypothetical protein
MTAGLPELAYCKMAHDRVLRAKLYIPLSASVIQINAVLVLVWIKF